MTRCRGGAAVIAALLLSGLMASAGCGGSIDAARRGAENAGPALGVPLRLADCSDWRAGTPDSRLKVLQALRGFYGSEILTEDPSAPRRRGPVLGEKQAYTILNRACQPPFAAGFKLYKLYGRADGFAGTSATP